MENGYGQAPFKSGLLTWVIAQDVVLADDVAAGLFDLDIEECREGVRIKTFLAKIVEADRGRVAKELYRCIAEGGDYAEQFDVTADGSHRRIAVKGQAVGDVLFTCIVMELAESRSSLRDLCFAAYDAARRENKDLAAVHLMKTIVMIDEPDCIRFH